MPRISIVTNLTTITQYITEALDARGQADFVIMSIMCVVLDRSIILKKLRKYLRIQTYDHS